MSERQLVLALAARGRNVPLGQLVAWRKDGLLPPLASCGTGNGRSYYWREPDILARAESVHDSLERHGRGDATIVTLWLQGFSVPAARLRRAWLHRARLKTPAKLRKASGRRLPGDKSLSGLLLDALLGLGESLVADDEAHAALLPLLARADAALDRGGLNPVALGALAVLTTTMLEASALMREAGEADLLAAQRHMRAVLDVLERICGAAPRDMAEALGPGLFLLALALLHTGQGTLLDALMAHLPARTGKENGAGRFPSSPVIHPYRITA